MVAKIGSTVADVCSSSPSSSSSTQPFDVKDEINSHPHPKSATPILDPACSGSSSNPSPSNRSSNSSSDCDELADERGATSPRLPASSYFNGSPNVNTSGGRKKLSRNSRNSLSRSRASKCSPNSRRTSRVAFLMANSLSCRGHSLAQVQSSVCISSPSPVLLPNDENELASANTEDFTHNSTNDVTTCPKSEEIREMARSAHHNATCSLSTRGQRALHRAARRESDQLDDDADAADAKPVTHSPLSDKRGGVGSGGQHPRRRRKSLISRAESRRSSLSLADPDNVMGHFSTRGSSSLSSPRPQPAVTPGKELPLRVVVCDQLFLRCYRESSKCDSNVEVWARHYDEHQRHMDPSFCWPNMASRHVVFRRSARRIFAPTTTSPSPSTGSPRFPLATSPTIPRYANTAQHTRTPEQHTAQAHLARDLSNIREAQQQQRSRSRQAVTAAAAAKENVGKTTTNTRVAQQHPVATVHTSANRKGSSPPNLSQLDVNTPASQHRRSTPLVNSNPSISMTSFSGGHGPPQQQQQQQHHVASSGNGNGTSPLFDSHLQMAIVRSVFQLCALPAQGVSFERFVDFVSEIGILGTSDSIHERRDVRAVFVAATGFTRKEQDPPRHVLLTQETFYNACVDLAVRKYSNNAYEALAQRYASNQHSMAFCLNCFIVEHLTVFVQNVHRRSRGFSSSHRPSHSGHAGHMKAAAAYARAQPTVGAAPSASANGRDYNHYSAASVHRTHNGHHPQATAYYGHHHHHHQQHSVAAAYRGTSQNAAARSSHARGHYQVSSHYSHDYRAPAAVVSSSYNRNGSSSSNTMDHSSMYRSMSPNAAIGVAHQQQHGHSRHRNHHHHHRHHHAAAANAHRHHHAAVAVYASRHAHGHQRGYGHTYGASHTTHDALSVPSQIPIRS